MLDTKIRILIPASANTKQVSLLRQVERSVCGKQIDTITTDENSQAIKR